jgi:DNA-binding CsgD family transcriptional regulator
MDALKILDAAYRLDVDDTTWETELVRAGEAMLGDGHGVCLARFRYGAEGLSDVKLVHHNTPLPPETVAGMLEHLSPTYVDQFYGRLRCWTMSESPDDGVWAAYARLSGTPDLLTVNGIDPDGHGCGLSIGLSKAQRLTRRRRTLLGRIAAHLATSARVRRQRSSPDQTPAAVLRRDGRVEHLEAEAEPYRRKLAEAVQLIEAAHRRPEGELEEWQGLVASRWSLLVDERVASDRYLVARRNEPVARGPEALTARERQVASYLGLGHGYKEIGYLLGISDATVRVLAARAMKKLGVGDAAAVGALARRWAR